MKKKSLESVEEVVNGLKEIDMPKMVTWHKVRTARALEEMVDKHGTVYIISPKGLPLKVTRAALK